MNTQEITQEIERLIAEEAAAIKNWTEDFGRNPFYALQWGDSMIEAAARVEVLSYIKVGLADGNSVETVAKELRKIMFRNAAHPVTTGGMRQMTAVQYTAAVAWVLETLDWK